MQVNNSFIDTIADLGHNKGELTIIKFQSIMSNVVTFI